MIEKSACDQSNPARNPIHDTHPVELTVISVELSPNRPSLYRIETPWYRLCRANSSGDYSPTRAAPWSRTILEIAFNH
jgi:hypothetical protein